jgi:hypothetical protein
MGWGENGYVRIHREKGSKGEPGQCGIASSPSVALGGTLLEPIDGIVQSRDANDDNNDNMNTNINPIRSSGMNNPTESSNDSSHPLESVLPYTTLEKLCIRLGQPLDHNSRCGRIADYVSTHRAVVLGAIGLLVTLLIVVWPLTWDCRRRAYRRQMRKLQQQQQQQQLENESVIPGQHNETSTLILPNGVADITYGTSKDRSAH